MGHHHNYNMNSFICDSCGEEGTVYLDNDTKSWHCEKCHFKGKEYKDEYKRNRGNE